MSKMLDVEKLIKELTLEEKISLLAGLDHWHTVPIKRLGIPTIRVSDGPNGIRGTKSFNGVPSSCLPCGTAMASSFNKQLLEEAGQLMAKEARLKGAHCILGPTCNIARGPLGGRAFESYSEDPLLSGYAASSVIKGIQSQNVLACIKHFVCNDQEDERKGVDSILTERALREIYLKPFEIAIRESDPRSLMTAYNKVNGKHASENKKLLQDILRKEWGFDGLVMSDWDGIYSTKDSLEAGLNLEMPGPTKFRPINATKQRIMNNVIHRSVIDENVRSILNFINEALNTGIPENSPERDNDSPETSALLRKIGNETLVLLKNQDNILPLSKTSGERIAIIGPNAKAAQNSGGGSAALNATYNVTPYDAIRSKVEQGKNSITLDYALGATLDRNYPDVGTELTNEEGDKGITAKFYKNAPGSEEREHFETQTIKSSRLFMSDYSSKKLEPGENLFYIDFHGFFTPLETAEYEFGCSCLGTAQLFVNDELIVDNKTKQVAGDAFFIGLGTRQEVGSLKLEKGKTYNVRVEYGTSPTYTLPTKSIERGGIYFGFGIKNTPEEYLKNAIDLAKSADKVILCVGLSKEWESEGFDRPHMDIPGNTNKLITEIAKVNSNVIVVNQSGSPVSMPWVDQVQGLVQAWYGGNELGNTIADLLFGDTNPSAKLSLSFPKKLLDNPSFLNFGSTQGHVIYGEDIFVGYRFYEKVGALPLFPFGYGLSYTTFEFTNLTTSTDDSKLFVNVEVKNTGKTDGAEVVQVYVSHLNPSVIKPVKELRGFDKIFLKAGEKTKVQISIPIREATGYWNSYLDSWESEQGKYTVLVGNSSDNAKLEADFSTESTFNWISL